MTTGNGLTHRRNNWYFEGRHALILCWKFSAHGTGLSRKQRTHTQWSAIKHFWKIGLIRFQLAFSTYRAHSWVQKTRWPAYTEPLLVTSVPFNLPCLLTSSVFNYLQLTQGKISLLVGHVPTEKRDLHSSFPPPHSITFSLNSTSKQHRQAKQKPVPALFPHFCSPGTQRMIWAFPHSEARAPTSYLRLALNSTSQRWKQVFILSRCSHAEFALIKLCVRPEIFLHRNDVPA